MLVKAPLYIEKAVHRVMYVYGSASRQTKKELRVARLIRKKEGKKNRTRYHQRTQHNARGTRAPRRKYVTLYRCIGQKITMATDTGNGRNDVGCSSLLGGERKKKK